MKYIRLFDNHAKFEEFLESEDYVTPYAVWCDFEDEGHLHKRIETRIVAKFNITDTSSETRIMGWADELEEIVPEYFEEVIIDGVKMNPISSFFQFETTGEHTIKYKLAYPSVIEDCAFKDCTEMTEITLPEKITKIDNFALDNIGLTSITIPESVREISEGAFSYNAITEIYIPENVTSINPTFVDGCASLTSIVVSENNTTYDSRNNCNAVILTSSNSLVTGCNNTVIPDNITSIGNKAFYGRSGLTSVTLPQILTRIGMNSFSGTGLTDVVIPSTVTTIDNGAFYGCTSMESIKCEAETPPALGNNAFDSTNNCPIYVPETLVDTYKSANGWSAYASRIEGYTVFEYVDMGLPSGTLWAKCNLGASTESETGLYYQWADTQGYSAAQVGDGAGQKFFSNDDYKYYDTQNDDMTKYNANDNKTVLDLTDDAAYVAIGNGWQVPHGNAVDELIQNSTLSLATRDNVDGVLLTSNENGNTLFFPWSYAAERGQIYNDGNFIDLWTSMLGLKGYSDANVFEFFDGGGSAEFTGTGINRSAGCVIRPVKYDENYVWPNP